MSDDVENMEEEPSLSDLINEWQVEKKCHRFSESGGAVRNFEALLCDMGFGRENGGFYEDQPIIALLVDNPGAVEALMDFLCEANEKEWRENLESHLTEKD